MGKLRFRLLRLTKVLNLSDKPADDPEAIGDPYKTLFISRLVISLDSLFRTTTDPLYSINLPRKQIYVASSKVTEQSNESE